MSSYTSLAKKALAGNHTSGERKSMSKSKGKRVKIRKKSGFGAGGFGSKRGGR